jgi:hypothetical protein
MTFLAEGLKAFDPAEHPFDVNVPALKAFWANHRFNVICLNLAFGKVLPAFGTAVEMALASGLGIDSFAYGGLVDAFVFGWPSRAPEGGDDEAALAGICPGGAHLKTLTVIATAVDTIELSKTMNEKPRVTSLFGFIFSSALPTR